MSPSYPNCCFYSNNHSRSSGFHIQYPEVSKHYTFCLIIWYELTVLQVWIPPIFRYWSLVFLIPFLNGKLISQAPATSPDTCVLLILQNTISSLLSSLSDSPVSCHSSNPLCNQTRDDALETSLETRAHNDPKPSITSGFHWGPRLPRPPLSPACSFPQRFLLSQIPERSLGSLLLPVVFSNYLIFQSIGNIKARSPFSRGAGGHRHFRTPLVRGPTEGGSEETPASPLPLLVGERRKRRKIRRPGESRAMPDGHGAPRTRFKHRAWAAARPPSPSCRGAAPPPAAGPGPGPRPRPPARPSTARTLPQRLTGDKRAACHGRWGHGRRGPARSQEGVSNRAGEGRACGLALPRGQGSPRP